MASKELINKPNKIRTLAPKPALEGTSLQGELDLGIEIERDVNGIGMGVLDDGTPYLNQRGLAAMCDVQNAQIGAISSQWNEEPLSPLIKSIKTILNEVGISLPKAHIEVAHRGITHFCYPAEVCLAILEYYAFHAGQKCKKSARDNFRLLAGSKLRGSP